MTRRKFLSSLALVGATPIYAFGVEPNWFEQSRHQVKLPKGKLAGSLRILHLSDFHASSVVPFSLIEKAIDSGLAMHPDLICLTGDLVTNADPFDRSEYQRLLRRLSSAAPSFACLGNHDGGKWAAEHAGFRDTQAIQELLNASRVSLLNNRSELVRVHGKSLRLVGVADLWSEPIDVERAFAGVRLEEPTVLLAHNPDTKDIVADHPWDLMLSGHTHGGQVLVPLLGAPFVPVEDKRFIAGLKEWNGRQIHVSRGIGSIGGFRVNCRPEVTLLRLASG